VRPLCLCLLHPTLLPVLCAAVLWDATQSDVQRRCLCALLCDATQNDEQMCCLCVQQSQPSRTLVHVTEHQPQRCRDTQCQLCVLHDCASSHPAHSGYAADLPGGPINAAAVGLVCRIVCRLHCHKVLQLSELAPGLARSTVINVHGVSAKFLEAGAKRAQLLAWRAQQRAAQHCEPHVRGSGCYIEDAASERQQPLVLCQAPAPRDHQQLRDQQLQEQRQIFEQQPPQQQHVQRLLHLEEVGASVFGKVMNTIHLTTTSPHTLTCMFLHVLSTTNAPAPRHTTPFTPAVVAQQHQHPWCHCCH
jgi:hypothetical protein